MTTLATLNTLRTAAGMKPLKVWKASKDALLTAIAKLSPLDNAVLKDEEPAVKSVKVNTQKYISITTVANELGMQEKVARAKLRRHVEAGTKVPHVEGVKGWHFTAAMIEPVKILLSNDRRKKA